MTTNRTTTTNRRVKIVFGVLIFLSATLVALAFVIRPFAGMFLHDSNFKTFDDVLTVDQRTGIFMSVGSIVMIYILLLVVSNVLWMAGAWYFVSRFKKIENPNAPANA
jgi:hypothetical protein